MTAVSLPNTSPVLLSVLLLELESELLAFVFTPFETGDSAMSFDAVDSPTDA